MRMAGGVPPDIGSDVGSLAGFGYVGQVNYAIGRITFLSCSRSRKRGAKTLTQVDFSLKKCCGANNRKAARPLEKLFLSQISIARNAPPKV